MSSNLTLGPVQIVSLDMASINLAFQRVQEAIDASVGLRGRAMVHDRLRVDDPSADDDAVSLGVLQAGSAVAAWPFHADSTSPLLALAPGTAYVELSALVRQQVNFASTHQLEARVLVQGYGTGTGNAKGVAITQSDGTVIAEVTWNGTAAGLKVGTFIPVSLTTDQEVQLRVKGSSATEAVILASVVFDLRYAIDFLTL
jgi:hypothetical protein